LSLSDNARTYHDALLADPDALKRLHDLRGWTREAISELGIGIDGNRVTIPIRDADGETVNLLRYAPNPETRDERRKILAEPDAPRDLFPAPESIAGDEPIVLVEGEPDAITGWSQRLRCVAVPSAAGKPRPERFPDREVVVLMDNDAPGDRCANAWAQAISRRYRCAVTRASWSRPGDDLTSVYLRNPEGFRSEYSAALLRAVKVEPRRIIALPGNTFAKGLKPADPDRDLLGPILRRNTRVGIAGFIGDGKTSLMMQMVAASAYGEKFFSYTGRGGDTRWLVLDLEQGESELKARLDETGISARNDNVHVAHVPDGLRIDQSAEDLEALGELLSQGWHGVALDPAYALLSSEPETETAARQFATTLDRFHRLYDFCLLVPMHTRKPLPRQVLTLSDVYGWSTITRNTQVVLGVQIWEPWVSMFSILKDRTGDVGPKGKSWKVAYDHTRLFHPLDQAIPGQEELVA
jgi:hypothetical protein